MKPTSCLLTVLALFCSLQILAQESIGRRYKLKDKVFNDKIPLQVDKFTLYKDLEDKKPIDSKIALVEDGITEYIKLTDSDDNEIIVNKEIASNENTLSALKERVGMKVPKTPDFIEIGKHTEFNGNVLFEDEKIYVNPWNYIVKKENKEKEKVDFIKDETKTQPYKDDKKELYYKLTDGQTVDLCFAETTITSLVIPIKYRFRGDEEVNVNGMSRTNKIDDSFATAFNLSIFLGRSWGLTKFNHRLKVGNKITTHKHSLGGILGTGAETLSLANTNRIKDDALGIDEESEVKDRTIGFLSLGGGYVYSRNKFAFGFFAGFDFGVGEVSNTWDYNNRLWIGFGIGYDIFKIQIGK